MNTKLLEFLIEKFTKEGETIKVTSELLRELDKNVKWCSCEAKASKEGGV